MDFYTMHEKNGKLYFEIEGDNLFEDFLELMSEKSVFNVHKEGENTLTINSVEITWLYENKKNIIMAESSLFAKGTIEFALENYKIIFEEENKIHDEQDNEENENYSDVDNFKEFHGPTHLHSIDLKDMFKLARQMDEMMNYYQDEFEQNEEMDPKEKSLRNYLENHKHNALIGALSLTQEEFIKLSSKDFKRVQDYIDEALQEDVLKHFDICKIDDANLTVFKVKPLMQELNIKTNFIKSKNFITKNIKEYFFDLLKAGAFVYAGNSERIATISHIYYFLQRELCEKYNEKKKALVFNNQLIEDFCSSLPNYKILNKVNLALQGCRVTRGKNRILMLDDIEDLYED